MSVLIDRVVRHKVKRAAKVLDGEIPNWHQQINPRTLDIAELDHCVLGQTVGFHEGLRMLRHRGVDGVLLIDVFTCVYGRERVTNAWLKEILVRLQADCAELDRRQTTEYTLVA